MMQEWVLDFVKSLVQFPGQVAIQPSKGTLTVVYHITVAAEDLSLFRDHHERLTKALNAVAGLAGGKDRTRYVVKFAA